MILGGIKTLVRQLCPPLIFAPARRFYRNLPWKKNPGRVFDDGFEGWGMMTAHSPPWADATIAGERLEQDYLAAQAQLEVMLGDGTFRMSSLGGASPASVLTTIRGLLWRHYVVSWSVDYAMRNTVCAERNLAECGVCDGLTMYFAINSASRSNPSCRAYLYDAWEGMRQQYLLASEIKNAGEYAYLDVENAKRNLTAYASRLVFNKGFVPDSFATANNPPLLAWLHIDLNSAKPTIGALEFFYDRIAAGGIILFDDYAWRDYEDTRIMVRKWLQAKEGFLLPLPTGQAIFFKGNRAAGTKAAPATPMQAP
jgi:O-methyltransferase